MASMWRKAMLYLGLGPDDEYDDYDVTGEHQRPTAGRAATMHWPSAPGAHDPEAGGSVRTLVPSGPDPDAPLNGNGVHGRADSPGPALASAGERSERSERSNHPNRPRPVVVRTLTVRPSRKPHVIGPTSFNDAQHVADKYKESVPVILNLQGAERDLSRRIIDFASGLCYGLDGQMERVAHQVYLLTPSDVEVSAEDRRKLHERGYEA